MAVANKIIRNPHTGQLIRFISTPKETGGEFLEMESTFNPRSKEPPPHYHPKHAEDFSVILGEITVRLNNKVIRLAEGKSLHIPKNTVHSMWNSSDKKTVISWKAKPALNFDNFLEITMGLAASGKTGPDGKPVFLQSILLADKYSDVYRLSNPSFIIQKILFKILTPVAYLSGYRSTYKDYID
jgi:quercetin dioxygenase-like cupin family protein